MIFLPPKRFDLSKVARMFSISNCPLAPLQVSDEEAVPELTSAVSGVLLTLSCHLAHCFVETPADVAALHNVSALTSQLEESAYSCAVQHGSVLGESQSGRRTLLSSSLQVFLAM